MHCMQMLFNGTKENTVQIKCSLVILCVGSFMRGMLNYS